MVAVGELLVSQVLTRFVTPVIYLYMEHLSDVLGRLLGPSPRREAAK